MCIEQTISPGVVHFLCGVGDVVGGKSTLTHSEKGPINVEK